MLKPKNKLQKTILFRAERGENKLHIKAKQFRMSVNFPSEIIEQHLMSNFESIGFYILH